MGAKLHSGGLMAEINVTPFVDVMLVLLIIFMVTAPMMIQGIEVELPQTRTVQALPTESDHLVLTIGKSGAMSLDEYPVTFEELQGHIKRLVVDKKKQLFLRADKEVTYGLVVRVMGELKTAGLPQLGVVAEPSDDALAPVRPQPAGPGKKPETSPGKKP